MTRTRGGAGIVAAILLVVVCHPGPAARQLLPSGDLGTGGRRAALPPVQTGRVTDLAPGTLLVASRELRDPNFLETVIVLVDHGDGGTMGLVVNRRTELPLSRVFPKVPQAQNPSAPVFLGGPVAMTAVHALVRSREAVSQGRHVADGIHTITTRRALEDRLRGSPDPSRFRVYLGYAGWASGQLAQEVGLGAWHIFPAAADAVFDAEPDTLWDRQIRDTELLLARASVPTLAVGD